MINNHRLLLFSIILIFVGLSSVSFADELDRAQKLYKQSFQLYKQGNYTEAAELGEQVLAIREKVLGTEHPDTAQTLNNLALLYKQMSEYGKAEALYIRALNIREKVLGPDHPDTLNSVNSLALLYKKMGEFTKAEPFCKQALEIKEKILGPNHPDTVSSLNDLASIYIELGDLVKAEMFFRLALDAREKALGPEHPDTADSLQVLGLLLAAMKRPSDAEPLHKRALQIRGKVLGPKHPKTIDSLMNLAETYQKIGKYSEATTFLKLALEIQEKHLGPGHPKVATLLNNLAYLYTLMEEYLKAEPLYLRALTIKEKNLSPDHPSLLSTMENLGRLYINIMDFLKAEPLLQHVLTVKEKKYGPKHPNIESVLTNLGLFVYYNIGDYSRAEPLLQRALEIEEKAYGIDHPNTAGALANLSVIYIAMYDYSKAEKFATRALKIYEKRYGPDHLYTGTAHNRLGILYSSMGIYSTAESHYKRYLEIVEKIDSEHYITAMSLNNLAGVYLSMGKYDKAEPLLKHALKIYEDTKHFAASPFDELGEMYYKKGAYGEAETFFQRALVIAEETFGLRHKSTAGSVKSLAFLYGTQDKNKKALEHFKRALIIEDHIIQNIFTIASEKQKLEFIQKSSDGYNASLSLINNKINKDQAALHAGLNLVLSRKGVVFDAQTRQREAIAKTLDLKTKELWDELSQKRAYLAKLLQEKPEKISPEDYKNKIEVFQAEIEKLESELSSKSRIVAEELEQRKVTVDAVAGRLPENSILAEFVKIKDYNWDKGKWAGTQRYLAFILHPDGKIELVDLGEAEKLESAIQDDLTIIKSASLSKRKMRRQIAASEKLYDLLWKPLLASIKDASSVIISPDGILNLVPFGAMRDSEGKYLIEKITVSYVTSGRDLLRGDTGIEPDTELFLVANPKFDMVAKAEPSEEPISFMGKVRSADFSMNFAPLPGTAQEAKNIPELIPGKVKKVITGDEATESVVLSTRRPKVLHLATHGFFLKDQPELAPSDVRSFSDRQSTLLKGYENPLVRSGLAFAGANHAKESETSMDGLLTALEVSGMDLHGTELVTLSACETGVGDVKAGEGVFGLRRAFALSGARNLLMSLWPVADEITAEQMNTFYRLYGQGISPAEALRSAQIKTIEMLRKDFGTAPPSLWAPFILQGVTKQK